MASVYESLVKEWLELDNYFVFQDAKFKKIKGYGDIDIIAVRVINGRISEELIGEVKSTSLSEKEIDSIEERFNNKKFQEKIKKLGLTNPKKYIFCWTVEEDKISYAKQKGIEIIYFNQIIDKILKNIEQYRKSDTWFYHEKYPLTILLQMIFHSYLEKKEEGIWIRYDL